MSCFFLDELQGTVCLGQSEWEVGAGISQRGSQTCWEQLEPEPTGVQLSSLGVRL